MVDNKGFIEKTNYLKHIVKMNFAIQAERLGVSRSVFDSYRMERVNVPDIIMEKLDKDFPDLMDYEPKGGLDRVEEPMILYSDGNAWKQLSESQKKLLDRIEEENRKLREENQRLEGENRALKEIISKRS